MYLGIEAVIDGPAEAKFDGGEGTQVENIGLVGVEGKLVRAVHRDAVENQLMKHHTPIQP